MEMLQFIFKLTSGGFVLLACMYFVTLPFSAFGDFLAYRKAQRQEEQSAGSSSEETFRLGPFFLPILFCLGYSAFFATFAYSFVMNRKIEPSWPYPIVTFMVMLGFVATSVVRLSVKEAQSGATYGAWIALIGFPCFYNFPKILESVPGAVIVYDNLVRLTGWFLDFWLTRVIFFGVTGGFLLIFPCLAAYWIYKGVSALANRAARRT